MTWSTSGVLTETVGRLKKRGKSVAELPRMDDIDEYHDVLHLKEILGKLNRTGADFPKHTWEMMQSLLTTEQP
jgi:glycosyltransferase A (GT-A) superfamily protein (DUF2064 family)